MPKVVPRFTSGLVLQRAAVFFDNARRDGQAQAGAVFFGGEERVEHPLLDLRRNAFAGVGHLQDRPRRAGRSARRLSIAGATRRVMVPSLADAVGGVLNQVDQHLFDLLRVDADPGRRGDLPATSRMLDFSNCGREQCLHLAQRLVGGHGRQLRVRTGRANCRKSFTMRSRRLISLPMTVGVLMFRGAGLQVFSAG